MSWGARVDATGLRVADVLGLFSGYRELSPNDRNPETRTKSRAAFERLIEFAEGVGAHGVTIIPRMDWPGESHADALGRAGDEMA